MAIELYIDNQLCEAPNLGKEKIAHSKQVNNIAELVDRQANYTNQFKLPRTAINRAILGQAENISSNTNQPYRRLPARLVEDGIEIIPSGYAVLQKTSSQFYEIVIYSGNADFFTQIDGKKLSDLDLSAYDHNWNFANVVASRTNTSGYIYGLIDYSDDQSSMDNINRTVDVRKLYPGMYVHTLMERIVAQTDYQMTGKILSMSKYLKREIPFCLDKLEYNDQFITSNKFKVGLGKLDKTASTFVTSLAATSINFEPVNFVNKTGAGFFDNANAYDNQFTFYWTVPRTAKYNLTANIPWAINTVQAIGLAIPGGVDLRINKIANPNNILLVQSVTNFMSVSPNTTGTQNVSTGMIALTKGDQIEIKIQLFFQPSALNMASQQVDFTIKKTSTFFNDMDKTIVYGGDIFMSGTMPDMLQVDFMKAIFQQLAIIPDADNLTKTLVLKQFSELYDNIPNAKDMSDKLDMRSLPEISFSFTGQSINGSSGYGQKNIMKYKSDTSLLTVGLGEGQFTIANETLTKEVTLIDLAFAATEDVTRLIGLSVCNIPKLHAGVFSKSTQFKIVMVNYTTVSPGVLFTDGTSNSTKTDVALTYFHDSTQDDSLDFNSLISEEYDDLVIMLTKLKIVIVKMYLTTKDMQAFNHFIPFYLNQFSQYFYVNLIENYIKEKLTTVHLIRM